ncbi:MAG: radical SAM domain-containing protein [Candidatus Saganbacteria bacterium]|uniref:Radical SAM domain-containing protein n=1 Tax=Candidatus Saganbacteria bacterium TaxID=2575572 RepID=A0A833L1I8_UNCSA|nr:MAG: radical SAM domain-containing protein [Candidatus Saganbacteria bacterium]
MNSKKETPKRTKSDKIFYDLTRSCCPVCLKLIDAQIYFENNCVFLEKHCPAHGSTKVLVSTNIEWFKYVRSYSVPYSVPLRLTSKLNKGCPEDCGLCSEHRQHTSIGVIRVTNRCDLNCPVCCVHNANNWDLPLSQAKYMFEQLQKSEGTTEIVSISGGEPTLHPQIIDIINYAYSCNVTRCTLSSNGIRIAEDEAFVEELAKSKAYINLSFDGFNANAYLQLRGKDLIAIKLKALQNLEKYNIPTTLIPTIAKDINEDEMGPIFEYGLSKSFIRSLHIQPLTHIGAGGRNFNVDLLQHVTTSDILRKIEEYFKGRISAYDFVPEPNECFLTGLFLKGSRRGFISLSRLGNLHPYLDKFLNEPALSDKDVKRIIMEISMNMLMPKTAINKNTSLREKITYISPLLALSKKIAQTYFTTPKKQLGFVLSNLLEEKMLLVNFHTMMDKYSFDQKRLVQCSHHSVTTDGQLIPECADTLFHSKFSERNLLKK